MTITLAIHGGCGILPRAQMSASLDLDFRAALRASLEAGWRILNNSGSALDAVEAAVVVMEDLPLFNAGHGAVFNADEGHELDAAIMDGRTLAAGALAAAKHPRNPIKVARAVMERSDCLLFAGDGADAFAKAQGFEMMPQSYFSTEWRRKTLTEMRALMAAGEAGRRASEAQKHGTVGAVALDAKGNLAAATSTGGFSNKPVGRVGDSPIIGAGTYADNATCADLRHRPRRIFHPQGPGPRHRRAHEISRPIARSRVRRDDPWRTDAARLAWWCGPRRHRPRRQRRSSVQHGRHVSRICQRSRGACRSRSMTFDCATQGCTLTID